MKTAGKKQKLPASGSPLKQKEINFLRINFCNMFQKSLHTILETVIYRTLFFIYSPYGWGIEQKYEIPGLAEMNRQNNALAFLIDRLQIYWSNIISAVFCLLSFISLIWLTIIKQIVNLFMLHGLHI